MASRRGSSSIRWLRPGCLGLFRKVDEGAILGPGGDEAIHCILDVMYAKAPYTVLQRAMHVHPTVSELIPTMLGELKPL